VSAPQFLCSACRTDADVPIGLKRYCVCGTCGRWDYCLEIRGGKAALIPVEHEDGEGEHWVVGGKRFERKPSAEEIAAAAEGEAEA